MCSRLNPFVLFIIASRYSTLGKLTGHTGAVTCLLVTGTGRNHDNVITGSKDHYIKVRCYSIKCFIKRTSHRKIFNNHNPVGKIAKKKQSEGVRLYMLIKGRCINNTCQLHFFPFLYDFLYLDIRSCR